MADKADLTPTSPEERQAMATVNATRAVYGEIRHLAEFIKEDWRPAAERADAKHDLVQASERLCNLMSLADYQVENNARAELAEKLRADLAELKSNLMSLGSSLMVEKLQKIDRRAEAVLQHQDYPIGLAGKLDIAFANLMSNLKVLGGAEKMGDKVPALVAKTETNIRSLAQIEQKVGVLLDVQPRKSRRKTEERGGGQG